MKTAIFTLGIAYIALAVIAAQLYNRLKAARADIKDMSDTLDGYRETHINPECADYRIHIEEDGTVFVYRHAISERGSGFIVWNTKIKHFTDDDADYNRICAEELCEMLNAKN